MYSQSAPELYGARVVKYIRCSHEDQVLHGDTLDAQNEILDDFIQKNHCVLIDTFVDEAMTARKKFTKRKEFVRLLDGVKRHDFDVILFTKLDRWFRNIGDYHRIQEILEANDVQWKAVTENYDTTTTNGRLHINIRLSVAQDECDRDSDRIKDVFAFKLKNKEYVTGSLPHGLKLDEHKHVVKDPDQIQYVLDAFDTFESCGSLRGTLLSLQEKYGTTYSYNGFIRMMRNPLYKGQYRDDPQFCDPVIDPERFDRLVRMMRSNVRLRDTGRSYIFSGLIVCDCCGGKIHAHCSKYTIADGTVKYSVQYRCANHASRKSCSNIRNLKESLLEEMVLSNIRPYLSKYIAEYTVTAAAQQSRDPAAERAKIHAKLKKLYDLFMDDLIDKDMYKSEYEKLQNQLKEVTNFAQDPPADLESLKQLMSKPWEDVYKTLSEKEKNAFWKSFVESIRINDSGEITDILFL